MDAGHHEDEGRSAGRWRYPGARPFEDTAEDQLVFRGRDRDAARLCDQILGSRLLVLFGKSGLGKTSLLNAGLFPRLRARDYLPVPIRLNGSEPPVPSVIDAFEAACRKSGVRLTVGDRSNLWSFLSTTLAWRGDLLLTPVLVFDQFEEVFTLRDAVFRKALAAELGALASRVAPAITGASGEDASPEPPDVKIVLSLREEYLGALQELSTSIPGLFQERFRLAPLADDDARKAIVEPAAQAAAPGETPFNSPAFAYDDELVAAMLAFLRGQSQVIEPFQLQLLCCRAEDIVVARRPAPRAGAQPTPRSSLQQVALADVGGTRGMEAVQKRFYDDTLARLPRRRRAAARRLCEEGLISPEGRRLMLDGLQIAASFGVEAADLDHLVNRRLLHREPRLESVFYEISHDRLADSIYRGRSWRLPKRWRTGLTWVGLSVAAVLIVLGVANLRLERAREAAETARAEAENLVVFLIGERFLERLRPVGRSEILADVQDQVMAYLERNPSSTRSAQMARGLAMRNGGDLMQSRGELGDAIAEFKRSAQVFEELSRLDPGASAEQARSLERLGDALVDQGELAQSLEAHRTALRLRDDIARRWPDSAEVLIEKSISHSAVGRMLIKAGRPREALDQHLDPAWELLEPLRTDLPSVHWYRAAHEALDNRAEALSALGAGDDAKQVWVEALKTVYSWSEQHPLAADARSRLVVAFSRLVDDEAFGLEEAEALHDEVGTLVRWDPNNVAWRRDLAATMLLWAGILVREGALQQASERVEAAYQALLQSVVDASDMSRQGDLAWALSARAGLAAGGKDWDAAIALYRDARERYARVAAVDPIDVDAQWSEVVAMSNVAWALREAGRLEEALDLTREMRARIAALMTKAPEMARLAEGDRAAADLENDLLQRLRVRQGTRVREPMRK